MDSNYKEQHSGNTSTNETNYSAQNVKLDHKTSDETSVTKSPTPKEIVSRSLSAVRNTFSADDLLRSFANPQTIPTSNVSPRNHLHGEPYIVHPKKRIYSIVKPRMNKPHTEDAMARYQIRMKKLNSLLSRVTSEHERNKYSWTSSTERDHMKETREKVSQWKKEVKLSPRNNALNEGELQQMLEPEPQSAQQTQEEEHCSSDQRRAAKPSEEVGNETKGLTSSRPSPRHPLRVQSIQVDIPSQILSDRQSKSKVDDRQINNNSSKPTRRVRPRDSIRSRASKKKHGSIPIGIPISGSCGSAVAVPPLSNGKLHIGSEEHKEILGEESEQMYSSRGMNISTRINPRFERDMSRYKEDYKYVLKQVMAQKMEEERYLSILSKYQEAQQEQESHRFDEQQQVFTEKVSLKNDQQTFRSDKAVVVPELPLPLSSSNKTQKVQQDANQKKDKLQQDILDQYDRNDPLRSQNRVLRLEDVEDGSVANKPFTELPSFVRSLSAGNRPVGFIPLETNEEFGSVATVPYELPLRRPFSARNPRTRVSSHEISQGRPMDNYDELLKEHYIEKNRNQFLLHSQCTERGHTSRSNKVMKRSLNASPHITLPSTRSSHVDTGKYMAKELKEASSSNDKQGEHRSFTTRSGDPTSSSLTKRPHPSSSSSRPQKLKKTPSVGRLNLDQHFDIKSRNQQEIYANAQSTSSRVFPPSRSIRGRFMFRYNGYNRNEIPEELLARIHKNNPFADRASTSRKTKSGKRNDKEAILMVRRGTSAPHRTPREDTAVSPRNALDHDKGKSSEIDIIAEVSPSEARNEANTTHTAAEIQVPLSRKSAKQSLKLSIPVTTSHDSIKSPLSDADTGHPLTMLYSGEGRPDPSSKGITEKRKSWRGRRRRKRPKSATSTRSRTSVEQQPVSFNLNSVVFDRQSRFDTKFANGSNSNNLSLQAYSVCPSPRIEHREHALSLLARQQTSTSLSARDTLSSMMRRSVYEHR